jgi:drug/metabolite transporter (DMT)-like permease
LRPWHKNGILLMALAVFVFSFMSLLVKFAARSVPSTEVVFFRSVINAFILVGIHLASRRPARGLMGKNRPLLLLRGVLGAGAMNLFFFALKGLPVADATLLFMISPVFVLPLAAWWLAEPVRTRQLLFVPLAVVGVFLVLQPEMDVLNVPGLCAIGSALLAAGGQVCIRKLASEDAHVVVLHFSVITALATLPLMLPAFSWPDPITWAAIAAVGVLSVPAQMLVTLAYRYDTAGRVAFVIYLGVLFALAWDFLFFQHLPGAITLLGAVLIVGAMMGLQKGRREGGVRGLPG